MTIYEVVLRDRETGDDVQTILVTNNVDDAADKAWEYNSKRFDMENIVYYEELMHVNDNPNETMFADFNEREIG